MYAGFMPIDLKENKEGSFFFWLAKSRDEAEDQSLIIWLNGGPGK